jgi:hypothetical protein
MAVRAACQNVLLKVRQLIPSPRAQFGAAWQRHSLWISRRDQELSRERVQRHPTGLEHGQAEDDFIAFGRDTDAKAKEAW